MTDQEALPSDARPWTAGRVLAWATVILMISMWVYVLYLAFGPGLQPPRDRVADPGFGRTAETICDAAHADVSALPAAVSTTDARQRAAVVAQANTRFARMLDDLAAIAPSGDDGEIVREWLADWHTYLGDREAYVTALAHDPKARLLVTAKDQEQITEFIDAFAADNRMIACATPIDV